MYVELKGGENGVMDFFGDDVGGFFYQYLQVVQVDVLAHDDYVDLIAVDAFGEISDEIQGIGFAKLIDYLLDDFVHTHVFAHDVANVVKQGMVAVAAENFSIAFGTAAEQSGLFETIEL